MDKVKSAACSTKPQADTIYINIRTPRLFVDRGSGKVKHEYKRDLISMIESGIPQEGLRQEEDRGIRVEDPLRHIYFQEEQA